MRSSPLAAAALGLWLVAGCASYTRSKIDLTEQATRGILRAREAATARQATLDALLAQRRKQLDAAFDADVVARGDMASPIWITDHRKAYAAGLDALERQRRSADAAHRAHLANLAATDAALEQLQQMHAVELQLTIPEVKR